MLEMAAQAGFAASAVVGHLGIGSPRIKVGI
jgi:hypothetical protein